MWSIFPNNLILDKIPNKITPQGNLTVVEKQPITYVCRSGVTYETHCTMLNYQKGLQQYFY